MGSTTAVAAQRAGRPFPVCSTVRSNTGGNVANRSCCGDVDPPRCRHERRRSRDPAPCAPAGGRRVVLSEFTGCARCSAARCVCGRRDPDDRRCGPEGTRRASCRVRVLRCHRGECLRPDPPCPLDDPSGRPARAEPSRVRARARRFRVSTRSARRSESCRIDAACRDDSLPLAGVRVDDRAHALEHSLEVQLPFLQSVLEDFAIVPFSVGDATAREVAAVLEMCWGGPETLVVISTDLSHYHPYADAVQLDARDGRGHRRVSTGRCRGQRCVRCVPVAWAVTGRRRVRVRRRATGPAQFRRHRR